MTPGTGANDHAVVSGPTPALVTPRRCSRQPAFFSSPSRPSTCSGRITNHHLTRALYSREPIDAGPVAGMLALVAHRGPEDEGIHTVPGIVLRRGRLTVSAVGHA